MPCGLFGKLPAKRDFIALSVPRPVLNVWEPWIEGAVSASRHGLRTGWTEAYLRAPIWRFWLGPTLAGEPLLGAIMPSADGIGRYFPLTLFCRTGHRDGLPPPEIEPFDGWFGLAESFLLSTLSRDTPFTAVTDGLALLPEAVPSSLPAPTAGTRRLRGEALIRPIDGHDVAASFERQRSLAHVGLHAGMSYWWTVGGPDFPALALTCPGLPDPYLFTGLLTGQFDADAV